MSSFDFALGLELLADGDTTWGPAGRNALQSLGYAVAGDRVMCVSPAFTSGNMPTLPDATDQRFFSTIQAAITAGEAKAWTASGGYTILIWPGLYSERLTIAESVALVGVGGGGLREQESRGVKIEGDGAKNSTILIDPTDGVGQWFTFRNLSIDNQRTAVDAVQDTASAYAIDCANQATLGSGPNRFAFKDCVFRMAAKGTGNDWLYGLKFHGWNSVQMEDCSIYSEQRSGDGVQKLIYINGRTDPTKLGEVLLRRCCLATDYAAATPRTIILNNDSRAIVAYSSIEQSVANATEDGGTGTNTFTGIAGGEDLTYRNIMNVNLCWT